MPISNASIYYDVYSVVGPPYNGGGYTKSDFEGKFLITMDYDNALGTLMVSKNDYLTDQNKGGEEVLIEMGNSNELEIKLRPLDAVLRIISDNDQPIHDSLYVRIQTKTIQKVWRSIATISLQKFPVISSFSNLETFDIRHPSEEYAYIYWSFTSFSIPEQAIYRDSVFLTKGDTTAFTISF